MTRASDIREQLHYIHPEQQLQAMQLTCCDAYGSMLWDLYSPAAQMFYNAWNNQVRQAWGVPRDTFTFLVEGFFGARFVPLRNMIKQRYLKFVNSLATSECKEVEFMFKLVQSDPKSMTRKNMRNIEEEIRIDIDPMMIHAKTLFAPKTVPLDQYWRVGLLDTLLNNRQTQDIASNSSRPQDMINGLCNSLHIIKLILSFLKWNQILCLNLHFK